MADRARDGGPPEEVGEPAGWVVLGLGANLGEAAATLARTAAALAALGPSWVAPLYRSAPLAIPGDDGPPQPDFWNTVVLLRHSAAETGGSAALALARDLLARGRELERRAGRRPGPRWGPRPLDVDVLVVGPLVHASEELRIPHPELRRRAFVLRPLHDLAPGLRLPPDGVAVRDLLPGVASQRAERVGRSAAGSPGGG